MSQLTDRMIQAAKLDVNVYEEVEGDETAMGQAMTVVIIASLAAGIGTISTAGIGGLVLGTIGALIGWLVWAYLTYYIGTRILPEPQTKSSPSELLRTTGFSSAPGVIRILGVIPGLSAIVFFVAGIWMLAAMIIAVRQALDYQSTLRAVGVCLIGFIVQAVVLAVVFAIFGTPRGVM